MALSSAAVVLGQGRRHRQYAECVRFSVLLLYSFALARAEDSGRMERAGSGK